MVVAIGIAVLIAGLSATTTWAGGAGFWSEVVLEVQTVQRDLHRQLATAIQAVQAKGMAASWALVTLSFLYGVFHAAGPGHGKVVISTYILTNESQLRRGLLLSISCALCQGLTAIIAVALMLLALVGYVLTNDESTVPGEGGQEMVGE